ncbi:(deoxy)nucleoside triphosphate pyrophosphohydrolase [Ferrimonas lipolytica]|uniref:8-oxo-dGTP diphosphatase n=1 Tax=Ferrimonas lipolytica TaxID=2724191 RepID=A0A6H1U9I3_9GAMM|nr:(deoxy)nucleoside triphosphate pyrophosphohydrolase [Ferrimonas lipolytica]QIZ75488.1 (deoxy)nucleoside triphosphate pyrophosphohydrolase [Ferrimonas lipolytica]
MILNVVAAVMIADGKIFVAQRHRSHSQGGLWEFPGGKVEPGETAEIALERELQEELSINVTVTEYLATSVHQYPDKTVKLHGYLCQWHGDQIELTGSHEQYRWLAPQQVDRTTLAPADLPLLDALINMLNS